MRSDTTCSRHAGWLDDTCERYIIIVGTNGGRKTVFAAVLVIKEVRSAINANTMTPVGLINDVNNRANGTT